MGLRSNLQVQGRFRKEGGRKEEGGPARVQPSEARGAPEIDLIYFAPGPGVAQLLVAAVATARCPAFLLR